MNNFIVFIWIGLRKQLFLLTSYRQETRSIRKIFGICVCRPLGCLGIHNLQALQRRKGDARRRSRYLLANGRASAVDLLLLHVFLQSLADAHLRFFVHLWQANATGSGATNGATRIAQIFLISVLVDLNFKYNKLVSITCNQLVYYLHRRNSVDSPASGIRSWRTVPSSSGRVYRRASSCCPRSASARVWRT